MLADCKCAGRLSGPTPPAGLMQETAPAQPSFYRRQLPSPPAIDFASEEGKTIFAEALVSGGLAGFFPLIAQFQTQAEPAYCGLASLSVALNALSIDPGRTWKGPWRWYDEALLDCCEPLEKIKKDGIVFNKLVCLARCAGAGVKSVLASGGSEGGFREDVQRATAGGEGHIIVAYSRRAFLQTGDGHFSPIGGYHAARDLVLILDVARFKYPPHWVPLPLLWQAMQQIDKVTGESRGYVMLTPPAQPSAALFSLARPDPEWWAVAAYASTGISDVLRRADVSTGEQALGAVLEDLPDDVTHLLTWMRAVAPVGEDALVPREGQVVEAVKDQILRQLRSLRIFRLVSSWVTRQTERRLKTSIEPRGPLDCDDPTVDNNRDTSNETRGTFVERHGVTSVDKSRDFEGQRDLEPAAKRARMEASAEQEFDEVGVPQVRYAQSEMEKDSESEGAGVSGLGETAVAVPNNGINGTGPDKLTNGTGRFDSSSIERSRENTLLAEDPLTEPVPATDGPTRVDLVTVLLLVCQSEVWASAKDATVREELQSLTNTCCLNSPLHSEILHLKEQYAALRTEAREECASEQGKTRQLQLNMSTGGQ